MKTIYKILSLVIILTLFNSCNEDEIQQDAGLVIPFVETIEGPNIVFIENTNTYQVLDARGGSEYIWTVTGADFSPVEGRPDQINVTFTQIEDLVKISVYEKASNGKISESITKEEIKVFDTPCEWKLDMQDSYGDGWNEAYISISFDGYPAGEFFIENFDEVTNPEGFSASEIIDVPNGCIVEVVFHEGAWDSEITYQLYNNTDIVFADGPTPTVGVVYTATNVCP